MHPEAAAGARQGVERKNLSSEEFQQLKKWLLHVFKARLEKPLQEKVEKIIEESTPWEVEKMISNLEITLAELEQQALLRGRMEGRIEGKMEGRAEGEANGKVDSICRYLKKRFGEASLELQQKIRGVNNLEVLDNIMEEVFGANTLEEAERIISRRTQVN